MWRGRHQALNVRYEPRGTFGGLPLYREVGTAPQEGQEQGAEREGAGIYWCGQEDYLQWHFVTKFTCAPSSQLACCKACR